VLVDTSAWVDFLNGYASPPAAALAALIEGDADLCTCGVFAAEVFQGLREPRSRARTESLFRALTWLEPRGIDTYLRAAELYRSLRATGKTIRSTVDCLIAVLAESERCYLLARDRDMEAIVASGLAATALWRQAGLEDGGRD
jgi:hypothetical protein